MIKIEFTLIKLSVLTSMLVLYSCATKAPKPFDDSELISSLETIREKEWNFGPSVKADKVDIHNAFLDKTAQYGLEGVEATNFNLVDLTRDDYTDLVVIPDYYSQPVFYKFNIHLKKFEPMASPFVEPIKASYILFYDLDRDHILDAIVGVLNQKTELSPNPIRIFKGKIENSKLIFVEKKDSVKVPAAPSSTVGLVDYDLDGDLDLFIGNWFKKHKHTSLPHQDTLLLNTKGSYEDHTTILKGELDQNLDKLMYVNAVATYGSQICDIDQNGFPDILTVSTNGYKNRLWMNRYKVRDGIRYFKDYGHSSLFGGDTEGNLTVRGGGRSFSLACADYNNDGIMDLYLGELTHSYDNELKDKSSILTGTTFKFPPFFYRTEYVFDTNDIEWHQADRRAIWFDYNNDGLLDLLVDNSGYPPHTRLILFKQHPDHSFENVSKELGIDFVNPLSSTIVDLNRDGKLDIISAQSNLRSTDIKKRIYVFENNTESTGNRSIRFYLRGQKANFHGLNAMVMLKVIKGGKVTIKRQNISYSYGGLPPQNEEGILFGLEKGESIESVKVRWPYSKSLNQSRAGLEKIYKIKLDFTDTVNITLCEKGQFLVGRRTCSN